MIDIDLSPLPNQSLTIQVAGALYQLDIKETRGVMSCTIIRDGLIVVFNARMVAGTPIIPYRYLESGNFVLLTQEGDYPDYNKFGSSQSLVFVTQSEIEELRNAGT